VANQVVSSSAFGHIVAGCIIL